MHRILGGVLSLPEDDRTTLLATARAWLEAHGSAAEAGRALYCHQNTVRYRMHRLEEFLRGPLDDAKVIAELSTAPDAVGTFPILLERRRTAQDGRDGTTRGDATTRRRDRRKRGPAALVTARRPGRRRPGVSRRWR
ncbi:hypothetical protein GCM10009801_10740 [Streptomyces albiaxialis]|uniref:PucR C-terminal helix-turn-helix domain-containing protein n=1 Tax=Streptomyces albiaxialis TaxID=329523 RepID=A0ABN2VLC1_9ACTN